MQISFVIPCRNNLKYFKWAYDAVRKNQGNHEVFICAADDASTDGTYSYFRELELIDDKFSFITNAGPERVGHTILYDRIVNELVKTDVAIIYHADMYLCPGALDEIEKHMFVDSNFRKIDDQQEKYYNRGIIVSLTRIEPPLHPPGPEKITGDFGTEPEEFQETRFLSWFSQQPETTKNKTTNGIFAPWAFFVQDFKQVYGHDPLYKPQSKEDSDIFNKFKLIGVKFIQTWGGCVYHLTCRGSRFNPLLTKVGLNSSEWEQHNIRSARNFIRKWGTFVSHNEFLEPIVKPKYSIGLLLENATLDKLVFVEPWVSCVYWQSKDMGLGLKYISNEQQNTIYDLRHRVKHMSAALDETKHDIWISCGEHADLNLITLITDIIHNTNEVGEFELSSSISVKINTIDDIVRSNLLREQNVDGLRLTI